MIETASPLQSKNVQVKDVVKKSWKKDSEVNIVKQYSHTLQRTDN